MTLIHVIHNVSASVIVHHVSLTPPFPFMTVRKAINIALISVSFPANISAFTHEVIQYIKEHAST